MNNTIIISLISIMFCSLDSSAQSQDSLVSSIFNYVNTVDSSILRVDTIVIAEDDYERTNYYLYYSGQDLQKIEKFITNGDVGDISSNLTLYLKKGEVIFASRLMTCFVSDPITIDEQMYFHKNRIIKLITAQRFYTEVRPIDDICGSYSFSEQEILEVCEESLNEIEIHLTNKPH